MDKRCENGDLDTNAFRQRTHQFEIIANTADEYAVLHGAMNSLVTGLLTGRREGISPANASILLGYLHDYAANPTSMTMSPGRAARFAHLLELGGEDLTDETDKKILSGVIGSIATEAAVRSFGQQLDSTAFDGYFAQ